MPNAPRTMDLDILAYGDQVIKGANANNLQLEIPHPRMHLRSFVINPLCDISPTWIHPTLRCTATTLRDKLPTDQNIRRLADADGLLEQNGEPLIDGVKLWLCICLAHVRSGGIIPVLPNLNPCLGDPMARVTVEDCVDKIPDCFDLVMMAAQRARGISAGAQLTVDRDNDKNPVVSLREIAEATVSNEELEEEVIKSLQSFVAVDEPDEDEMDLLAIQQDLSNETGEEPRPPLFLETIRRRQAIPAATSWRLLATTTSMREGSLCKCFHILADCCWSTLREFF